MRYARRLVALRPARFALVGATAAVVQLALLRLLLVAGMWSVPADAVAFLVSAQVNFALSCVFTWRDRNPRAAIVARWLGFHSAIAGTALLNVGVFAATVVVLPDLAASALGIVAAAVVNFVVADRAVFRPVADGCAADAASVEESE